MKLVLRAYLASLRERGELDAILPDLLAQMGMTVFTKPGRGTRQDGVDVGAVGVDENGIETVFLFSIKGGDVDRRCWDGEGSQSLKPSLDDASTTFIRNRLPLEHKGKPIVIRICCGGDILETVRPSIRAYIEANSKDGLRFDEWNGDKLAELILKYFLREGLFAGELRSLLRRSIAMVDEPETSEKYFTQLIQNLTTTGVQEPKKRVSVVRQLNLCLWTLFSWAREEENIESSYRAAERVLLTAWELSKSHLEGKSKADREIQAAFFNLLNSYQMVTFHYLNHCVIPHADTFFALSHAVIPMNEIDVNLRLFDVMGRTAIALCWLGWLAERTPPEEKEFAESLAMQKAKLVQTIKALIQNNPVLFAPIKDQQVIEIAITAYALIAFGREFRFVSHWFREVVRRISFSFLSHGKYPTIHNDYLDLLDHPKDKMDTYREKVTCSSVLYPTLALIASAIGDQNLYARIEELAGDHLKHCSFQLWFPDEVSEQHLYLNDALHGGCLPDIFQGQTQQEFLGLVKREINDSPCFSQLSAIMYGLDPLVLVACRHHRLPVPPQFLVMGDNFEENMEAEG